MLNVSKEQKGNVLIVRLTGTIEETANFDKLIGVPTVQEMHVYLKDIPRINSVGVRTWVKYFSALQQKKINLKFFECATSIVEQINLISNFACGGTIESIYVPFACESCKSELIGLFKTEDIRKVGYKVPELKCSKCGGRTVFDDLPDEYFGFLMKK